MSCSKYSCIKTQMLWAIALHKISLIWPTSDLLYKWIPNLRFIILKTVSEGGNHTPGNLIVLCHTCHKDKAHRGSLSAAEQRKIVRNRSKKLKDAIKIILDKAKARQKLKKLKTKSKKKPKKGKKRKTKSPFDDFYKPPVYKPPVYKPPKFKIWKWGVKIRIGVWYFVVIPRSRSVKTFWYSWNSSSWGILYLFVI